MACTAATREYDLIVLDIMLPGIDGYQVCKRLREDARRDTPIIMLTARDAPPDRIKGLEAGADDYLIKPFALSELVARIEAVLRRTRVRGVASCRSVTRSMTSTLAVSRGGVPIRLNPIGHKLLAILMQRSRRWCAARRWRKRCGATTYRTATACAATSTSCAGH